jgi:hypothetical protein
MPGVANSGRYSAACQLTVMTCKSRRQPMTLAVRNHSRRCLRLRHGEATRLDQATAPNVTLMSPNPAFENWERLLQLLGHVSLLVIGLGSLGTLSA